MSAPPLLDEWLQRLKSSEPLDLAEFGHAAVPELLAAYTPDGFELRVHPGSTLWLVDGLVVAELSAELHPLSPEVEGTGVIQRRIDMTRRRADHIKFELPEAAQGQGRGRRVLRASVDLYEALGIDEGQCVSDYARFFDRHTLRPTLGCFTEHDHGHLALTRLTTSVREVPALNFNVYRHGTVTDTELDALSDIG